MATLIVGSIIKRAQIPIQIERQLFIQSLASWFDEFVGLNRNIKTEKRRLNWINQIRQSIYSKNLSIYKTLYLNFLR